MHLKFPRLLLLFSFLHIAKSQSLVSPCPNFFKYEERGQPGRWFGVVTLVTEYELHGVWVMLKLNAPAVQLGNWFGEVLTDDNIVFVIRKPTHKLPLNSPYLLRFYIQYDPSMPPPQVEYIRLNGKTFCPEGGGVTAAPSNSGQLITSPALMLTTQRQWQGEPTSSPEIAAIRPIAINNEPVLFNTVDSLTSTERTQFIRPQIFAGTKPSSDDFPLDTNGDEEECGVLPAVAEPVISQGIQAKVGEIPWHVAIYHTHSAGIDYACGGSLISRIHVLTAGHCVCNYNTPGIDILPPDQIVIYLGKDSLTDWSSSRYQMREVERVVRHPGYNTKTFENDIAIVKLTSASKNTVTVKPVCLWEKDEDIDLLDGIPGVIAGFGYDEFGKVSSNLLKTYLPVIKQTTCVFSFPDFYSRYSSQTTFCAGIINGTTVCNGDSGGGLIFSTKRGNKKVHFVRGIASIVLRNQDATDDKKCNPEHYPIFTDIAKFLSFIQKAMKA